MKPTMFPVLVDSIGCSNGQVAEQAEAVAAMRLLLVLCNACGPRMVPRRPHCAEGVACLRSHCSTFSATHLKAAIDVVIPCHQPCCIFQS